jgi:hypothetical protein
MKLLTLLLATLLAAPSIAQERVFRASSIDIEQNDRLSSLEGRVTAIETKPTVSPPRPEPLQISPIAGFQNLVKAPAKQKPYAVITIESLPGCQPCERWLANEGEQLKAKGWVVEKAPLTSSNSAPFFRICIGDRCFTHRGPMSHSALRAIISNVQPEQKATAKSNRYTTEELRAMIRAKRPGGWTGPVYADVAPRSAAKQHLVGPEHMFSWDQVSGLTQDEALILHDLAPNHGNQIFPTRDRTSRSSNNTLLERMFR